MIVRRTTLAGALALTRAEIADMFQYRTQLFIYALWSVIGPIVYLAVWGSIAGDGDVGGLRQSDFAAYYLTFMLVTQLTVAIEIYTFGPMIQQGELSPHLLRPMNPVWVAAARNISYKSVSMLLMIPLWFGFVFILRPEFSVTVGSVALFVAALMLAALLSFLVGTTFALLAFWTTRSYSFWEIWVWLTFLLGGQVAPVELLPGFVQNLATALPMRYTLGFPIEVLLNRLDAGQLALGFALQILWLAAAALTVRAVWRAGIRQYSAVGA
ncbi:MAG: hypothetical protein F4Y02_05855 [Chloroflexi bacterium]|nr:hypothetical protein [Chloroflexota bacterium]